MLGRLGHEVVGIADTHDEALRVARVTKPDFAFVDLKLRDGFTGMAIVRRLQADFGLYCAFVTGNAEQIGETDTMVVKKPFTAAAIASALPSAAGA